MQFLFNVFNHNSIGQRSLEDPMGIIGHQLRALGHHAVWEPNNERFVARGNGFNMIVEGFTDSSIGVMAEAHAQGAEFVIIATEEPTEKGFNYGTQKEMVRRQDLFHKAAKFARGILHLVPGEHVTRWYSQFAPTAQAELGYAPTLMRPQMELPKFDFGFYGSVTARRLRILKKLARQGGTVKVMGDFKEQAERDRQMQKAKVLIQLRKFEVMGLVSSSRCNTALAIGRPVLGEPHLLVEPWGRIVQFTNTMEEFLAQAMFYRAAWQGIYQKQLAAFKKLTPEICVGEPLRKIGVLDTDGGRAAA
jgi:hypothetical protein